MANLPEDMQKVTDAISGLSGALATIMQMFPKEESGSVPQELLRSSTRLALVSAANACEYAVTVMKHDLAWANAKVLTWAAAEAEWKALQLK